MKDNQAKYPQLRFKGFTDPWEQRKLGDAVSISSGVTGDATLQDGEYRLTRIESISQGMLNVARLGFTNEKPDQKYLLNLGDILYSNINSLSHIGKVALVDTAGIYHGINLLRFQMRNDVDSEFLFQRLNTMPMKSWAASHANPAVSQASINQTELSKQPISSPTITEQQKIGSFFKQLDDTIALHQRKLAKLKELKQGYLQKMFPKNGSKFPQLRFAGFADAWEERKLSSISERVTRKNKNNESTLPLTISAQDGLVDQNDFFNKQVASRDVTGYFLVKNGEFAYNKSYSNGYPWGAIKRLDKYDMGVLSTLYIVFRPTKINSQFLVSYYDTTRWYREVSKNAAEGARNHGLLNIAPTDFFNTLLVVPKIVDEQQKIGSFFKQLDDTIALHQRKLEKLQELKKGYLQKMFC